LPAPPQFLKQESHDTVTEDATELTVSVAEDGTGQFFGGYIARVAELQKLTKEFNKELALIEDSDESDSTPCKDKKLGSKRKNGADFVKALPPSERADRVAARDSLDCVRLASAQAGSAEEDFYEDALLGIEGPQAKPSQPSTFLTKLPQQIDKRQKVVKHAMDDVIQLLM